jgi:NADH:ubiquinone oxidoreductase subunit 3 (subunit A)
MEIEDICFIVLLAAICVSLVLRYLIRRNIIKPSVISRIFYQDDESFINSWKKTRKKGLLKYIIKNIIFAVIMTGVVGMINSLYNPNRLSIISYLSMGVIVGLIFSISWSENKNKYNLLLKENFNNSDKCKVKS